MGELEHVDKLIRALLGRMKGVGTRRGTLSGVVDMRIDLGDLDGAGVLIEVT